MKVEKRGVSLWKRGFAFLIDIFIINILVSFPFRNKFDSIIGKDVYNKGFFEVYNTISAIPPENIKEILLLISVISVVSSLIYFTALEYKLGSTLGKMLFKIKVVSDKKKPSIKQFIIRNITKSLFLTNFSFLLLIDLFYVLYSGDRRLTEKWSETHVEQK